MAMWTTTHDIMVHARSQRTGVVLMDVRPWMDDDMRYGVTVIGTVIGGWFMLGCAVTLAYVLVPARELIALWGWAAVFIIGAMLGCWYALFVSDARQRGATVGLLGCVLLLPATTFSLTFTGARWGPWSSMEIAGLWMIGVALSPVLAALAARWVACRSRTDARITA